MKLKNRKYIRITAILLTLVLAAGAAAALFSVRPAAADVKQYSYKDDRPFFNDYLDQEYRTDDSIPIDRWFDQMPKTTNTSNFCSLDTAEYPNINGKTVYVDTLYRKNGESLNDPNFAEGILIYECIQYKVKHPEADVELYFSTYRMSSTAAVCIDRNSRYFGYMRSLFDCEYDAHGFVRISFMLVEAAKMGIHVTVLPQLNSYAVNQYSETAAKGYEKKTALSYKTYFNSAQDKACYSEYADGKKVSDFMDYSPISWNVDERGSDMHHIKTCLASNYIAADGKEYSCGVYLTSSNLDDNDFKGRNGNTGSQSGIVISNHDAIYNVTKNYLDTIWEYRDTDDITKFRDYIGEEQARQIDLIRAGKASSIPEDKRLVYIGSDSDSVFEMYFTPLPGASMVWDTEYNPYCRALSEMAASKDSIIFSWNMPYCACSNYFEYTFEDVICEAFHRNRNKDNRMYMHFEAFDQTKYNDLKVGTDIGFKKVNTNISTYIHSKDLQVSYVKDGARQYVSIISSCNFGVNAYWLRSNSVLVVKETEKKHPIFDALGNASSYGCITK